MGEMSPDLTAGGIQYYSPKLFSGIPRPMPAGGNGIIESMIKCRHRAQVNVS